MEEVYPFLKKLIDKSRSQKITSNLSVGEPFENIPQQVKERMIRAVEENKHRYTPAEGLPELREALAQKLRLRNKISADPGDIIITNGVSGGYDLALLSILAPGDEVILTDPYFATLFQTPQILNFQVRLWKTKEDFSLDFEILEKLISKKTKAIVVNSPANPTGSVYSQEELTALAKVAQKHDLFIISDEIYEDFVYEGKHFSVGSLYEKTVSMFGFSKSLSMTGWRLGYNIVPKDTIEKMVEIQRYLFYAPSTVAQHGALIFNEVDIGEKIASFDERRKLVLKNLSSKYEVTNRPAGAFYVFPKLPKGVSGEEFSLRALEAGVLIFPGSLFSQNDAHFRISYSAGAEELESGITILNSLV
jgi:aspartate aminotransferase/aminotransferase